MGSRAGQWPLCPVSGRWGAGTSPPPAGPSGRRAPALGGEAQVPPAPPPSSQSSLRTEETCVRGVTASPVNVRVPPPTSFSPEEQEPSRSYVTAECCWGPGGRCHSSSREASGSRPPVGSGGHTCRHLILAWSVQLKLGLLVFLKTSLASLQNVCVRWSQKRPTQS